MKNILIILAVTLVAATNVCSQPQLACSTPMYDFGYTPQRTHLVHSFWFKSIGTDTVVIEDIKTGCACAVMPLERNDIAPGDSMKVSIHWDIEKHRGGINRIARIFTNGGPDPLRLHLKGTVLMYPDSIRPISSTPYRFLFAKSERKDIDSLSFVFTNHSKYDLTVSLISELPEQCLMYIPDSIRANTQDTGWVKLKPEYADTEFKTSITLLVSDKPKTHFTIPVERKFYLVKE